MRLLRTAPLGAALFLTVLLQSSPCAVDLARPYEPVVVTGSEMTLFLNAPVQELYVYSFVNGAWKQIAFQIDEKDDGTFWGSGNMLLNSQDEICFMAADMGDSAADHQWIADSESMMYQRYQIKAINTSLSPNRNGYAYLYRSSTLAIDPAVKGYMSYVPAPAGAANDTIRAKGYILGHNSAAIPDYLALRNGAAQSADILDRWKIRYNGKFYGTGAYLYSETEDTALNDSLLTAKAGRIRAFRRLDFKCLLRTFPVSPLRVDNIYYPFHSITILTQDSLRLIYGLETLRQSLDLNSSVNSCKFYNRYNSDIVINGVNDAVNKTYSTTLLNWQLIQGSFGSVVTMIDSISSAATQEIYYRDDSTVDITDTGDGASYGDSGILLTDEMNKLTGTLHLYQTSFYLGGSHTITPLVDSLVNQRHQPLQRVVSARSFVIPVELASFSGRAANGVVTLNWTTASETNNYGFEVLRQDGKEGEWKNIGFVKGNGTTNRTLTYGFEDPISKAGSYRYQLKQVDVDGAAELSSAITVAVAAPASLILSQNYPNPFNPSTEFSFQIPAGEPRRITLCVYNMIGQRVRTLVSGYYEPGFYRFHWDGADDQGLTAAGGVYLLSLQTDQGRQLRKMIKLQ
ncbi:MAG TPA: FlgD immunoglobulin-like domain containing protein [bacterium]|nr:FlgD immunoglobulin-like domain containing protein [bacterium]